VPARVAIRHARSYLLLSSPPNDELRAEVCGRLLHSAAGAPERLPAVGDWVAAEIGSEGSARIHAVLPRRGKISRAVAGGLSEEQVLAAHVDLALVVAPLGGGPVRLRRLERTLAIARHGGVTPVVVLTKADLAEAPEEARRAAISVAGGAQVLLVSALSGGGIAELRGLLRGDPGAPATTAVLLGASGVGKSTLLNALLDAPRLRVQDIRDDGKGRHTTTHRELVLLPGGGCLIDTPGVREIALWDDGAAADGIAAGADHHTDGIDASFADLAALASSCRFGDCSHAVEPGCAVRGALERGEVDAARVISWQKLARELSWVERRHDDRARADVKRAARVMSRAVREVMRVKRGRDD
jgi:ribosome biogenesis GTPase